MKKIDFWRLVKANCENDNVGCCGLPCKQCPLDAKNIELCDICSEAEHIKEALAYANKQIKRHEGKSKKRIIPTKYTADVQPDKTGAVLNKIVTLPKEKPEIKSTIQCYKCISVQTCKRKEKELSILPACDGYISNESMNYIHTVDPNEKKVESVLTTTPSNGITTIDMSNPTPLDIAKAIRDNGYRCESLTKNCFMYSCPFGLSSEPECPKKNRDIAKRIIDDYIAQHDHIEDKLEMVDPQPTEPKPISFDDEVPEYVYHFNGTTIRRVWVEYYSKEKSSAITVTVVVAKDKHRCLLEECYRTPEEALAVALKRWQK